MEQPKYFEYMLPELQILNDNKTYARNELIELAAQKLGITKEQKEELMQPNKGQCLNKWKTQTTKTNGQKCPFFIAITRNEC